MYRLILLLLALTISVSTFAQDGVYGLGGRNNSLAETSVALVDNWAIFNNPGALGTVDYSSVFSSYQNRYGLQEFQVIGGGFVYHHPHFNSGIKYFKFGDPHFNQQMVGLVMANRFQMVSLGLGINVVQNSAKELETRRAVAFEFGGVAEITKTLSVGAHIFNIKHRQLYPTTMKAGFSLVPINTLRINLEVEKQLGVREKVKTGLEYYVIEKLYLRTGLSLQNNQIGKARLKSAYGLGLELAQFLIDYAFRDNSQLGAIHEISLTYKIQEH